MSIQVAILIGFIVMCVAVVAMEYIQRKYPSGKADE